MSLTQLQLIQNLRLKDQPSDYQEDFDATADPGTTGSSSLTWDGVEQDLERDIPERT